MSSSDGESSRFDELEILINLFDYRPDTKGFNYPHLLVVGNCLSKSCSKVTVPSSLCVGSMDLLRGWGEGRALSVGPLSMGFSVT